MFHWVSLLFLWHVVVFHTGWNTLGLRKEKEKKTTQDKLWKNRLELRLRTLGVTLVTLKSACPPQDAVATVRAGERQAKQTGRQAGCMESVCVRVCVCLCVWTGCEPVSLLSEWEERDYREGEECAICAGLLEELHIHPSATLAEWFSYLCRLTCDSSGSLTSHKEPR